MLDELEFMKRFACYFCEDYAAEFADISFGGIGAEEGWTTVITRTPLGRAIFADAKGTSIEISGTEQSPDLSHQAFSKVRRCSDKKRSIAKKNRKALQKNQ
jgi:coenzyme F420 hydrogenase subunit beta